MPYTSAHAMNPATHYNAGNLDAAYTMLARYGTFVVRADLPGGESVIIYRKGKRRWGVTLKAGEVIAMEWEPLNPQESAQ